MTSAGASLNHCLHPMPPEPQTSSSSAPLPKSCAPTVSHIRGSKRRKPNDHSSAICAAARETVRLPKRRIPRIRPWLTIAAFRTPYLYQRGLPQVHSECKLVFLCFPSNLRVWFTAFPFSPSSPCYLSCHNSDIAGITFHNGCLCIPLKPSAAASAATSGLLQLSAALSESRSFF